MVIMMIMMMVKMLKRMNSVSMTLLMMTMIPISSPMPPIHFNWGKSPTNRKLFCNVNNELCWWWGWWRSSSWYDPLFDLLYTLPNQHHHHHLHHDHDHDHDHDQIMIIIMVWSTLWPPLYFILCPISGQIAQRPPSFTPPHQERKRFKHFRHLHHWP